MRYIEDRILTKITSLDFKIFLSVRGRIFLLIHFSRSIYNQVKKYILPKMTKF